MTTYYQYENGELVGTSVHDPSVQSSHGDEKDNVSRAENDPVGAYLAHRALRYPRNTAVEADRTHELAFGITVRQGTEQADHAVSEPGHPSAENSDSQLYAESTQSEPWRSVGCAGWAAHSGQYHPYPNPEHIRHLHTLHSLLPYIQPERRLNALNGPTVDIVEQDTEITLAYSVPKKLLVLFLGRQVVSKFIKTMEREDDENWRGGPVTQRLFLPRYKTSKVAVKILVAWMIRACQYHTMGNMNSIQIPTNTFAMCSLAQTMDLLSLRRDAYGVDLFISEQFRVRPIFASELETLWNCMEEKNRYLYAAIKTVGNRLRAYEAGRNKALTELDDMFTLLEANPLLNARVRDLEVNEQYRPIFGMEWMKTIDQNDRMEGNKSHGGDNLSADHKPPEQERDSTALQDTGFDAHFSEQSESSAKVLQSKVEDGPQLDQNPRVQ